MLRIQSVAKKYKNFGFIRAQTSINNKSNLRDFEIM